MSRRTVNLFVSILIPFSPWAGEISPRLERVLPPEGRVLMWVDLVGEGEVPDAWVEEIAKTGARVRVRSKWLRSVSVRATKGQLEEIASLPFVRGLSPVARFRRAEPMPLGSLPVPKFPPGRAPYGPSFFQLDMLGVPELHKMGLTGEGIRIAVLDAGFDTTHPAVLGLKIIAFKDFVKELADDTLEASPTSSGNGHGLSVLSVLGGRDEGKLVGPAYGAEFILARTENTSWEWPLEEDAWIAAAEWADSLGADIISSSLGYFRWDDGTGYSPDDLDGDTPRITRAADEAVRRGILVVTAAGNEAQSEWGTLICPGDGDSVITVGAVDEDLEVASFSSQGPTSDGRVKPDLVALGVEVLAAWTDSSGATYRRISGTSIATPLITGLSALILQAHPDWSPIQVREALRRSAHRALSPSCDVGWGVPYGPSALEAEGTLYGRVVDDRGRPVQGAVLRLKVGEGTMETSTSPQGWFLLRGIPRGRYELDVWCPFYAPYATYISLPEWDEILLGLGRRCSPPPRLVCSPNPVGQDGTVFSFPLYGSKRATLKLFSPSGELVWSREGEFRGEDAMVRWEGRNMEGRPVASGVYLCVVEVGDRRMVAKLGVVR